MNDQQQTFMVTGRYTHASPVGDKTPKERIDSKLVKADSEDAAVVKFCRTSSIAALKRGIHLSAVLVNHGDERYFAQYENPGGCVQEQMYGPLGDLIITADPTPREVYRG